MNYCERIPAKTESVVLSGENVKIDTEGMEATVASVSGTVYIKANGETGNENAFILESGGSIVLNGRFYLNGDNANVRILYCRII